MERAAAIATLNAHEAELKWLGVQYPYLFGSVARGDVREASDVDLFFDHECGKLRLFHPLNLNPAVEAPILPPSSRHHNAELRVRPRRGGVAGPAAAPSGIARTPG